MKARQHCPNPTSSAATTGDAPLTADALRRENRIFGNCGGTSASNRNLGFVPAFLDTATNYVYRACFRNGQPAPVHLLDGLPADLVICQAEDGRVTAVKPSVISGFLRGNRFYTREQAAAAVGDTLTACA